jgi:hypothetical protein
MIIVIKNIKKGNYMNNRTQAINEIDGKIMEALKKGNIEMATFYENIKYVAQVVYEYNHEYSDASYRYNDMLSAIMTLMKHEITRLEKMSKYV